MRSQAPLKEKNGVFRNTRRQFDKYSDFSFLPFPSPVLRTSGISNIKHTALGSCLRAQTRLTERKRFRRSRARFCSPGEILSRAGIFAKYPRPATGFLDSWTKLISRGGSDLLRDLISRRKQSKENVARRRYIISRLTEQGEIAT